MDRGCSGSGGGAGGGDPPKASPFVLNPHQAYAAYTTPIYHYASEHVAMQHPASFRHPTHPGAGNASARDLAKSSRSIADPPTGYTLASVDGVSPGSGFAAGGGGGGNGGGTGSSLSSGTLGRAAPARGQHAASSSTSGPAHGDRDLSRLRRVFHSTYSIKQELPIYIPRRRTTLGGVTLPLMIRGGIQENTDAHASLDGADAGGDMSKPAASITANTGSMASPLMLQTGQLLPDDIVASAVAMAPSDSSRSMAETVGETSLAAQQAAQSFRQFMSSGCWGQTLPTATHPQGSALWSGDVHDLRSFPVVPLPQDNYHPFRPPGAASKLLHGSSNITDVIPEDNVLDRVPTAKTVPYAYRSRQRSVRQPPGLSASIGLPYVSQALRHEPSAMDLEGQASMARRFSSGRTMARARALGDGANAAAKRRAAPTADYSSTSAPMLYEADSGHETHYGARQDSVSMDDVGPGSRWNSNAISSGELRKIDEAASPSPLTRTQEGPDEGHVVAAGGGTNRGDGDVNTSPAAVIPSAAGGAFAPPPPPPLLIPVSSHRVAGRAKGMIETGVGTTTLNGMTAGLANATPPGCGGDRSLHGSSILASALMSPGAGPPLSRTSATHSRISSSAEARGMRHRGRDTAPLSPSSPPPLSPSPLTKGAASRSVLSDGASVMLSIADGADGGGGGDGAPTSRNSRAALSEGTSHGAMAPKIRPKLSKSVHFPANVVKKLISVGTGRHMLIPVVADPHVQGWIDVQTMQMIPIMFLAGFTVTLVFVILYAVLWTVQSHQFVADVNAYTSDPDLRAQILQSLVGGVCMNSTACFRRFCRGTTFCGLYSARTDALICVFALLLPMLVIPLLLWVDRWRGKKTLPHRAIAWLAPILFVIHWNGWNIRAIHVNPLQSVSQQVVVAAMSNLPFLFLIRGHVAILCQIINLAVTVGFRVVAEDKPWVDVAPAIVLLLASFFGLTMHRSISAQMQRHFFAVTMDMIDTLTSEIRLRDNRSGSFGIVTTADVFAARLPHAGRNLTTRTVTNLLDVAISTGNSEQYLMLSALARLIDEEHSGPSDNIEAISKSKMDADQQAWVMANLCPTSEVARRTSPHPATGDTVRGTTAASADGAAATSAGAMAGSASTTGRRDPPLSLHRDYLTITIDSRTAAIASSVALHMPPPLSPHVAPGTHYGVQADEMVDTELPGVHPLAAGLAAGGPHGATSISQSVVSGINEGLPSTGACTPQESAAAVALVVPHGKAEGVASTYVVNHTRYGHTSTASLSAPRGAASTSGRRPAPAAAATAHQDPAQMLDLTDYWTFDVFELTQLTVNQPIAILSHYYMLRYDLYDRLRIPQDQFLMYMFNVQAGYRDVPYHNAIHAADVAHSTMWLAERMNMRMPLTAKELFCLLFSALVHDYDHPGVNNNFLIQTNSPMALLYNDRSVLENHHVASALRLLLRPELNFLSGWAREEMAEVRSDIITLVLSTDLQVEHFSTLTHFKTLTSNPYWTEGCVEADPAGAMSHPSPPVMNKKDRVIVMKMLLKCADVANPSKRWPIYSEWFARYTEETFQQGDEERRLGLPISPLCDRSDVQLPKSQLGFIEFITLPLYEALHQAVAIPALLDNLSSNHSYWQRVRDKVLAPPAASTSPPGPAASATIIVE